MKKKFTTTLEEDLIKELKMEALNQDISVAELIEKLFYNFKDSK